MKYDYYEILKIREDAPDEVIRSAYRALSKIYHPDRNPNDPESERAMTLINLAYETLIDPAKRMEYDFLRINNNKAYVQNENDYYGPDSVSDTPEGGGNPVQSDYGPIDNAPYRYNKDFIATVSISIYLFIGTSRLMATGEPGKSAFLGTLLSVLIAFIPTLIAYYRPLTKVHYTSVSVLCSMGSLMSIFPLVGLVISLWRTKILTNAFSAICIAGAIVFAVIYYYENEPNGSPVQDKVQTKQDGSAVKKIDNVDKDFKILFDYTSAKSIAMKWIPPGEMLTIDGLLHAITSSNNPSKNQSYSLVKFPQGFWISETPITQSQWNAIMRNSPIEELATRSDRYWDQKVREARYDPQKYNEELAKHYSRIKDYSSQGFLANNKGESLPIIFVSWTEAMEYCRRLTALERNNGTLPDGYIYTLPSEFEWEFAARGREYKYNMNNPSLSSLSHTGSNSTRSSGGIRPVAMLKPNSIGLHDIYGNVSEWTRGSLVFFDQPTFIGHDVNTSGDFAIIRGASWVSTRSSSILSERIPSDKKSRFPYVGFRIALVEAN